MISCELKLRRFQNVLF